MQEATNPPSPPTRPTMRVGRDAIVIRKLNKDDIFNSIVEGWTDLKAAPVYGLTLGLLHALGGWAIIAFAAATGLHYFAYPLLSGIAIIAPFMAAALYEVSRRLERGEPLGWGLVLHSVRQSGGRDLGWMALVSIFGLIIWVDFAFFLYLMFYGAHMPNPAAFIQEALSTTNGLIFLLVGNLVGGAIAFFIFSITVVSCPLLLDRDVDFVSAMIASVKAVAANPWQMLAWAFVIALMLAFGLLSGLLGMIVVLPLLGHASWHVYRKLIAP